MFKEMVMRYCVHPIIKMLGLYGFGFLGILTLYSSVALAQPTKATLMILPVQGTAEPARLVDLQKSIEKAAALSEQHQTIDPVDVTNEIESARDMGVSCSDGEISCFIRLGILMQAKELLLPTALQENDTLTLKLHRIEVNNPSNELIVERSLKETGEDLNATVQKLVQVILHPERYGGSLYVAPNLNGATIFLDDTNVGLSPLQSPLFPVSEGEHLVRIEHPGYVTWEDRVVILSGELQKIDVKLVPTTEVVNGPADAEQSEGFVEAATSPLVWVGGTLGVVGLAFLIPSMSAAAFGEVVMTPSGSALLTGTDGLHVLIGDMNPAGDFKTRNQTLGATRVLWVLSGASVIATLGGAALISAGLLE